MGRASNPRRAAQARLLHRGANHFALPAAPARQPREGPALDDLPAQPRQRVRRDGLLRRAHATFRVLYGFFVIGHGRRRILHFNATFYPTAEWVVQHLREAFPEDTGHRHLLFDRDAIFSAAVVAFVRALGVEPVRSAYRSPWQNPVAERWIGSCRRELLDHIVVFGERHLVTLVRSYLSYYHDDRTHLGLGKDAPAARPIGPKPSPAAKLAALPRVGGLHHRYEWRAAA